MTKNIFLRITLPLILLGTSFSLSAGKRIGIVAHRGFWNCEEAGFSENSLASLKAAQVHRLWGSECDVRLTGDGVVIVNHDDNIKDGAERRRIDGMTYGQICEYTLPNGEVRPTFMQYLDQYSRDTRIRLVVEFKEQGDSLKNAELVDKVVAQLKIKRLFKPRRIVFISFSRQMCDIIAAQYPRFTNQYLSYPASKGGRESFLTPQQAKKAGYNGIDYQLRHFKEHPEWVPQARKIGLSVNVWTVNGADDIKAMAELGVDQITTNEPLLAREIIGKRER